MEKTIIYQVLPRLFGNKNENCIKNGTKEENGTGKFNDLDNKALGRIRDLGATHIWLTGVIRHATQTDYSAYGIPMQNAEVVKGKAGSPYAIADYYDIDPDLAVEPENRMKEFEDLVTRAHNAGLKVVIDFVPNHVARQYKSICKPEEVEDIGEKDNTSLHFSTDNNFYYCWGNALDLSDIMQGKEQTYQEQPAKATGNDQFSNRPSRNDWYETVKLNYGIDYCDAGGRSNHFDPIPDTWDKMTAILLFWASKGVDAFRCDMAEMVPPAFWAWATDKVKYKYPEMLFIGEVYNPSLYRTYLASGFDLLYDKVGMYDTLRHIICGLRNAGDITWQWQSTDDIREHMLYFLENHDEQRIASDFFAADPYKAIPALIVSVCMHTNPFMIYCGQEFGEPGMDEEGFSGVDGRTTIFDYWSVGSIRRGFFDRDKMTSDERTMEQIYKFILQLANDEKALKEGEFFDLMYMNQHISAKQYAFLRKADNDLLLVVTNFDEEQAECDIVIPSHAFDYLNIAEKETEAIDLLSGDTYTTVLRSDSAIHVSIPPHSGRILKFTI
ncbi:MAG: alpha-amylase [Prevotella sp.]|nr:alpha-amylase [Prevotella sp.]